MADGLVTPSDDSEVTMADTIRETWQKLQANNADEPIDTPAEPVEPEAKPAKARDEAGKFAAKEKETDGVTGHPAPAEAAEDTPAPKKTYVPKWKKEALEKWSTLDPVIQSAVEQRDQDFHKGIEGYKSDAEFGKSFRESLQPFEANYASHGLSAQQAAAHLFNVENILRRGSPQQKLGVIAQLAQDYQIPLQAMLGQQQGQPQASLPAADPALYQRLAAMEQMLNQKEVENQRNQEAQIHGQIEKAAEGKEHFELLRETMGGLLQSGTASDLESAYDQAMQLHPVTRPIWLAEQQAKWRQESTSKAEAARKAAGVNMKPRGFNPPAQPVGTMADTIAQTMRNLNMI